MRIDITGRHVDITSSLRQLIERRVARLERVLNDSLVSIKVILTIEKYRHRTEIIVHARGDHTFRGLGEGNAWPLSVRQAVEKLEQQIAKLKTKWTERKRSDAGRRVPGAARAGRAAAGTDGAAAAGAADRGGAGDGRLPRVVRASRYPVRPMSVEDAVLRLDGTSDAFIVFRNADSDAVSILFRRKDGNVGLIEPD